MTTKHFEQTEVVPDFDSLVNVARELVTAAAAISIGKRGFFRLALSGGSTPRRLYKALADDRDIDWKRWQLFFGDERCVPPTHEAANFRMIEESLIERLPLDPFVLRIPAEADPDAAAASYENTIRKMVPGNPRAVGTDTPRFDMILLGMGVDGHTAGLFPASQLLHEKTRLVAADPEPHLGARRISVTYPLINAARRVLFLVSGEEKAATLRAVLAGPTDPVRFPSQGVHPTAGNLIWLVDADAYSAIQRETE